MTRTKTLSFLTAAAAGALLAACAVGPKAPEAALPTSGTGGFVGAANPAVIAAAPARDDLCGDLSPAEQREGSQQRGTKHRRARWRRTDRACT